MITVLEKVIFLRKVDVFSEVANEQLALIAAIAEERTLAKGTVLYREGDAANGMAIIVEGKIRLHRGDVDISHSGANEAFGTWALFDDEPRLTSATAVEETRLLWIDKEEFIDLLADHVQVTQGVLKAVVRRLRGLLGRAVPKLPSRGGSE